MSSQASLHDREVNHRARPVAAKARCSNAHDPGELIEDDEIAAALARGDAKAAAYWQDMKALIDACPPIEPEHQVQLRAIFAPTHRPSSRAPSR